MSEQQEIRVVDYQPQHHSAFRALNVAWIEKHWTLEAADFEILDHPVENVLDKQGHIFIALSAERVLGTCALLRMSDGGYELAKMAVAESARGLGVGYLLGLESIARAKTLQATRIFLESNTILQPAIELYRKLGFKEIIGHDSPYTRCNIQMELQLKP